MAETKYTVQSCRLFVEDECGNPVRLPGISIQSMPAANGQVTYSIEVPHGKLPDILDTIFPRNWYLVYQSTRDDLEFFDPDRLGRMVVLEGVQIRYEPPELTCLLVDVSTGQLHVPEQSFTLTIQRIRDG